MTAFSYLRVPWVSQPPIGTPAKVDYVMSPQEYTLVGRAHNLGRDKTVDQSFTVTTAPALVNTPHGVGLNFPGTVGQGTQFSHPLFSRAEGFTAITTGCWVRSSSFADDNSICGQFHSTSGDAAWRMELDVTGVTELRINVQAFADDDTSIDLISEATIDVNDGEYHYIVGVIYLDSANLLHIEGWVDGVLDGSDVHTSTGWNVSPASRLFEVGEKGGGDPEPFNGDIVGLFVDRTRWDEGRILRAYNNHWDELFEPLEVPIFLPSVATGIDTREKRASVIGVARPWARTKEPGTVDEAWRLASGFVYAGNALSPVVGGRIVFSLVAGGGLVSGGGIAGPGGGLAG